MSVAPEPTVPEPSGPPQPPSPRRLPPPPPRPGQGSSAGGVVVGRIVDVEVVAASPTEVEVRLADGRTGVIPRSEFTGAVGVGDVVPAALLARDDPRHRVVLSHAWARKQRAWERIEEARAGGEPVTGTVTKVVKGGVVVDVGLRGFLPVSLLSDTPGTDPASLVGTEVQALVHELDRAQDRIVLSRKDWERKQRRLREKEVLAALEPGGRVRGTVVSVADYGAVVDLGGPRGLVHRSELSWHRFETPGDVVAVGDELEVVVLEVQRSKRRVSLSLRRTTADPLDGLEPGEVRSATVCRVVEYGAFARIDDTGAEGLVHLTELTDVPGFRPDQLVAPGEQVMVKVMDVDRSRRRLALSVRRVLVDD